MQIEEDEDEVIKTAVIDHDLVSMDAMEHNKENALIDDTY